MNKEKITLCTPHSIRVWRGFRSRNFFNNRAGFDSKIGRIFAPQTVQQMEPLGLCAYFPALLPNAIRQGSNDRLLKIPDEIALVVYPSRETYDNAVKHSVAGRAYSLLHRSVFNFNDSETPHSQSDFPESWSGKLNWDTPCSLVSDTTDWRSGVTRLLVAQPRRNMSAENFHQQLNNILHGWLQQSEKKVNGSIICVCPEYLLYWEHGDIDTEQDSLLPPLLKILESPYVNRTARIVFVPPAFYEPDEGIDMSAGDFLDVRVGTDD